jgi:hypothetical protein
MVIRCPICKKRVESTVNFQLLSTSEEEYLALNVRRFISHFRDNPNFAKCVIAAGFYVCVRACVLRFGRMYLLVRVGCCRPVTVISVIGRHTREQAADLYKITEIRERFGASRKAILL